MDQNYQPQQPNQQYNNGYGNNNGYQNNGGFQNNNGGFQNGFGNGNMPPKPDNNMVLAILVTLCCCLPLGIVGIVKASQVNSLYMAGQYQAAVASAADAKKWSMIGLISGLVINVLSFIFYFMAGMCSAMM